MNHRAALDIGSLAGSAARNLSDPIVADCKSLPKSRTGQIRSDMILLVERVDARVLRFPDPDVSKAALQADKGFGINRSQNEVHLVREKLFPDRRFMSCCYLTRCDTSIILPIVNV